MNSFEGAVRERFLLMKKKKRMPIMTKSTTTPTTTPTMMGVLDILELVVFESVELVRG